MNSRKKEYTSNSGKESKETRSSVSKVKIPAPKEVAKPATGAKGSVKAVATPSNSKDNMSTNVTNKARGSVDLGATALKKSSDYKTAIENTNNVKKSLTLLTDTTPQITPIKASFEQSPTDISSAYFGTKPDVLLKFAYESEGKEDTSLKLDDSVVKFEEPKNVLIQKETELTQLKKVIEDKKEIQVQLTSVRKERDELRKKIHQQDELINICMKELEESTKQIEVLNLDKINSDAKYSELENQIDQYKKDLEQQVKKLEETELDLLIKIEEFEEKNFELEKANAIIKDLKSYRTETKIYDSITNLSTSKIATSENGDQDEASKRIIELEDQVTKLAAGLVKITDERNYEVFYLQTEIEKLNKKLQENSVLLEDSFKKDALIKSLEIKVTDTLSLTDELKEQLAVFSHASTMMDNLIYEKSELETQLLQITQERNSLKNELNTNDMLIEEYETAIKISSDFLREKDNSILQINNTLSLYKQNLEDAEKTEKNLLNVITDLKTQNQIMREEISKTQNIDVDEILNKNVNTNSRLQTLERKKVLKILNEIDLAKTSMKNLIFNAMIPQKIIELGYMESFDKFLIVRTLRKKTLNLIFNIIDNDILQNSKDLADESFAQTNKTFMIFVRNVLQTLIDFNILLHSLEITFSQYNQEQFKAISASTGKTLKYLWTNISAATHFIDNLINHIKEDSFSVKYQYEGLKSIIKTLKEDIKTGKIDVDLSNLESDFPIILYENELLNTTMSMLVNFKEEMLKFTGEKSVIYSLEKNLMTSYKKVKTTLKLIDKKFFLQISYENSSKIFESENSYFKKLIESGRELVPSTSENTIQDMRSKYDTVNDNLSKICVVVTSFIEKYEKELSISNNNSTSQTYSNNSVYVLPLKTWTDLTLDVYNELDSGVKIKEGLEAAEIELKQTKYDKVTLESKIEEMLRAKKINDQKLGEALVAVGKVAQLESEIEDKNKKIEKYNTTVEALIKNIEMEQEKNKELKLKIDTSGVSSNSRVSQQPQDGRSSTTKRPAFIGSSITSTGGQNSSMSSFSNTFISDSIPLLNTIHQLQRERKLLKTKITKDKVEQLLYDKNSYINRYINKSSKAENDIYGKIEDPVCNINENLKKFRNDLCLSKVYDLTQPDYNYSKTKSIEENQIKQIRINYMQDVDKVFNCMFADHNMDGSFKEFIDNDIKRYLLFYFI